MPISHATFNIKSNVSTFIESLVLLNFIKLSLLLHPSDDFFRIYAVFVHDIEVHRWSKQFFLSSSQDHFVKEESCDISFFFAALEFYLLCAIKKTKTKNVLNQFDLIGGEEQEEWEELYKVDVMMMMMKWFVDELAKVTYYYYDD